MGKIVSLLAAETGLMESAVVTLMRSAPIRYKRYSIPKRSGGQRAIAQPAREIKVLQRALTQVLLADLPVHGAATAYRAGISIRHNAEAHSKSGPILKMDFSNFFPSIRVSDWRAYCAATGCISDEDDIDLTSSLLFHRQPQIRELRLAIGAPSSPVLSNILMFDFDVSVQEMCSLEGVTYTRYADDLTFSAPRTGYLNSVRKIVDIATKSIIYPRVAVNENKTVLATKKYKRFVTGLVIANDGSVGIGRDKKRLISAKVHHFSLGRLNFLQSARLSGHLSFVNSVDPEFLLVLDKKYGSEVMKRLTTEIPKQLLEARRMGKVF